MSEFKGTPGEWYVSYRRDGWGVKVTNGAHNVVTFNGKRKKTSVPGICDLVAPSHADLKVADAHLIAAAPDLLERLIESNRHLVGEFGLNHPLVKANRAAIAKALGEEHDQ